MHFDFLLGFGEGAWLRGGLGLTTFAGRRPSPDRVVDLVGSCSSRTPLRLDRARANDLTEISIAVEA
ncbi:MAG: hypothetical protein ACQGVC_13400, partial [Myxococcota bacterium]